MELAGGAGSRRGIRPLIFGEAMRNRSAGYFWLGALIALCMGLQVGCATVTAVRIPGPVPDDLIELGDYRADVEIALQTSVQNEYAEATGTTVRYLYKSGPHQGSKARVILYIAGDIFTLFLTEFIFWPIEAYASNQTTRVATAHYDQNNVLIGFFVNRGAGDRQQLIALGKHPEPLTEVVPPVVSAPPAPKDEIEGESEGDSSADPAEGETPDLAPAT